ncbi:MAG: RIP metalloprotease RseP [Alphaproteobacteria bacterium]|nr:RIP metalloprotease RseP [Alphaproteobacteria bacterium]
MSFSILDSLSAFGGGFAGYVIPFLFVLTIVVFFHELGHFLVARWCGVRVLVFSVGFGPELLGFTDRKGTRWKISAIPLGGYVKFFGDENAASVPDGAIVSSLSSSEQRESFHHQPVGRRSAIVAAGPIANFILAIVIFAAIFTLYGKQTTAARIDQVQAGSPAAAAGLQPGDIVLAIDGRKIESFSEMQRIVSGASGRTLEFRVDRGGAPMTVMATPSLRQGKDGFGNSYCHAVLGVSRSMAAGDVKTMSIDPLSAVWLGTLETWFVIERTFSYLSGVIVGKECADQLGGPIRIAQISGQVATISMAALFNLTAMLSVSIGLLNLFPVPLLDGGHLLFYGIEAARGRPLSERAQEIGFRIGLALVLMLMIFATFNDILHLAAS